MPRFLLLFILAFTVSVCAETSIPLPRQGVYMSQGLSAGVGVGLVGRKHCKRMSVWQGQMDYAYSPGLSGGANIKFYGGNLDEERSLVYQRYTVHAKFHWPRNRIDVFLGPRFGFDNTSLQEMRQELLGEDGLSGDSLGVDLCAESIGAQGMSFGYESGLGLALAQDWGLNIGHSLDLTTEGDTQFGVSAALAYNIWNHWERLRESLQSAWLIAEGHSVMPLQGKAALNSLVLGFTLGF